MCAIIAGKSSDPVCCGPATQGSSRGGWRGCCATAAKDAHITEPKVVAVGATRVGLDERNSALRRRIVVSVGGPGTAGVVGFEDGGAHCRKEHIVFIR